MEDIFNPKERIKKFKIDNKEEEYFKFPSPNYLERYGRLILDLMNIMEAKDKNQISSIYFIKQDLKNFLADINGNLTHDYEKRNVRYLANWKTEKGKIDAISNDFLKAFENYMNSHL